mmetsp:Transcript_23996/g.55639  ORF Transcript_23996/g.55639 Transcript_23996/m.55639 type:complete len:83 (-) Transcript_23996:494-742(-)
MRRVLARVDLVVPTPEQVLALSLDRWRPAVMTLGASKAPPAIQGDKPMPSPCGWEPKGRCTRGVLITDAPMRGVAMPLGVGG